MRTRRSAVAVVAVSGAITYGVPDGNGHPEVGALLAPQAYSDGTWATCTGTLIAPTVFLTAAHCDGAQPRRGHASTRLRLRQGHDVLGHLGRRPAYDQAQSDPHDLAVVLLDKAVKGITPARLPAAGSLAGLAGDQQFTSVGYGAQAVTSGPGGKTFHYADVRYVATGTLNSITPSWLRISQNPAHRRTAARATATRAGRTSSAPARPRRTSSPPRRSPATRRAARRTSTTGSTRRRRARSSGGSWRCRSSGRQPAGHGSGRAPGRARARSCRAASAGRGRAAA